MKKAKVSEKNIFKLSWRRFVKPILIFVVGPVIVGLIVLRIKNIDFSELITKLIHEVVSFFTLGLTIPVFGIILIALAPLTLFIIIKVFVRCRLPTHLEYTTDIIEDIKWHWSYYKGNGQIIDHLKARCPECQCLLKVDYEASYGYRTVG